MAKRAPQWLTVLIGALASNTETCGRKRRLRNAARGKTLTPVQGQFIVWVLREFIAPCAEAEAVAALWERRMAGDEPTPQEWQAAGDAARQAAMAANAGDLGVKAVMMGRGAGLTTPMAQRSRALVEPELDPAALTIFQGEHAKAVEAAHSADTCDTAWSAALVHWPDAMRGVVTSAARTAADVPWAYGQMTDKLFALLEEASA